MASIKIDGKTVFKGNYLSVTLPSWKVGHKSSYIHFSRIIPLKNIYYYWNENNTPSYKHKV